MKLSTLKKQAGMTLTESLLVLAVGALVAVLAYGGYKMATSQVSSQSQIEGTVQLVAGIKRVFGTGNSYSDVNVANVINSKIVPPAFKTTGTASIDHAWGGTITPAVGNQAGATPTSQFKLTITAVPTDNCVDFVAGISNMGGMVNSIWVGGTAAGTNDVKPAGGAYSASTAATRCAAAATSDVIVVIQ